MDSEFTLKFTIHRDQHSEELHVRSSRVLAGSAAHCEVRLEETDAAPEQLLFEIVNQTIIARSRSRGHSVLVDGNPFSEGPITPSAAIELGCTRLTAELVIPTLSTAGGRGTRGRKLGIYILGSIGFPLGLYLIFTNPNATASAPPAVDPPRLVADAPINCPQVNASEAQAVADNEQLLAQGMRERAPFYAQDGVRAVPHFRRAAACYQVAGDRASGEAAQTNAQNLEQQVNREFHVHRARLDYALSTAQYDKARNEVRLLSSYLGDQPSEFKTRLKWIDQQIQLKHMERQGVEP